LVVLISFAGCATRPISHVPCAAGENGCEVRGFALRLEPGDDLRLKLMEFATRHNLHAAYVITCVGSLKAVALRFADQKGATVLEGPFEIVSLVGTLSPDGPHLHVSVSDATGRTFGGHLAEGSIVYTTAEVVIGELPGARFTRQTDPVTTYKELKIQ
jgi:predicted DNA-binding protein with PD1-like motif